MVDVMELDEKRVMVDITPDYKAMFARSIQSARFDAQDIEKKMPPAPLGLVRSLMVNLNIALASVDSTEALEEFRAQFAAMMHNIAVEDEKPAREGFQYIFNTTSVQHARFDGQLVTVVRPLTDKEADLEEVGPMFKVRAKSGTTFDVFGDELSRMPL